MSAITRLKKIRLESLYPKLNKQCRLCKKKLKGRQTSWCSVYCSEEAFMQLQIHQGHSGPIRWALRQRDNEICANCGVDCKLIKRIFDHAGRSISQYKWDKRWLHPHYMILRYFGFKPFSHTWEADHIVEVRHGGEHDLENLQTLCIKCHKEKTKANAGSNKKRKCNK